ncbi:sensor histidine kinase [Streptosporangium sp. NPDC003464]
MAQWLRESPPARIDLAITVAVTAATVVPLLLPAPRAWWVVALAVLASVPILWRRRAPMATGLVVALAMSAMVMWEKPLLPYGPMVSLYTIAALGTPRQRLLTIPVAGLIAALSLVLPQEGPETYRFLVTALVAAYALGTGARARRAQAAELEERARRLAQERDAAAARERTRIARDMHDIVTHSVGLMVVQAEAGPVAMRSDPARAEAAFDAIGEIGRGALVQLRDLLGTLRSGEDAGRGPRPGVDSLPELVERTGRTGLKVTLAREGEPRRISAEVDVAAYRIVQEALTNVLRHSDAGAVRVRLTWTRASLEVVIADDGGGAGGTGDGHGLTGMRERAAACGGTLHAGPGPGGFVVSAVLPVR